MMAAKTYTGRDISVSFDMKRCIHARNCFLKLPAVFDPAQRPWVQPDNAPAEEIAAMVRTCPSGALKFEMAEGTSEAPPKINRLAVLENGPLAFAGDIQHAAEGDTPETRLTLCRCGKSKNKPYCDYSHVDAGFTATGEPAPKTPDQTDDMGGSVDIKPIPNGPLMVAGNVEITTGTGGQIAKHAKAFLCRCGESKNKPYCDGSHTAAGFTDS